MHLAIANLTGGGMSGGSRKYLERMIPLLRNDPRIGRLDLFIPPQSRSTMKIDSAEMEYWPAGDPHRGFKWVRARVGELRPDVVFVPNARWLDTGTKPLVVMLRNMEPHAFRSRDNPLLDRIKLKVMAWSARQSCRRANHVIAISQFVRDFLIQQCGIAPERIGFVPHGMEVPPQANATCPPKSLAGPRAGPFLFTAGSLRPARGLEDAIEAMAVVHVRHPQLRLLIAGGADPRMQRYVGRLQRLAELRGVAESLCWLGPLTSSEMSWCFHHCQAFVMTSRVEACPNTVLESMAHGCLCISTDSPPMPEFYGSSACYYRAGNGQSLADRLLAALDLSPEKRRSLCQLAKELAGQYRWQETAARTIRELERVTAAKLKPPKFLQKTAKAAHFPAGDSP